MDKATMSNRSTVSTKETTPFRRMAKFSTRQKNRILGGVCSLLLLFSPYLFYLYEVAPADSDMWELGFITIHAGGFKSVQIMCHAAISKLFPFLLLSMAYFNLGQWWKYFFMVPIGMFLYQFLGVINYQSSYIDDFDFYLSLPILVPLLALIMYLDRKLKLYALKSDLQDFVQKEINRLTNTNKK